MHDLYLQLQELWLGSAGDPALLYVIRTICGAIAALTAMAVTLNAARPNRLEQSWRGNECRVDQVTGWMLAVGLWGLTAYFFAAATFEMERTSTPNRLLFLDVFLTLINVSVLLRAVANRTRYSRKRALTPGAVVK